jgi:hypothetical protein
LALPALAGASLYYANDWWLSGVMTVSIVVWLTGVLAAIYRPATNRAAIIGAVLAGFLYVLLALGPWFRVHVGPWLLTSQGLVHVETRWLGRQPQSQQQLAFTTNGNPYTLAVTGSGAATWQQVMAGSTLAVVNTPTAGGSTFLQVGHWLCGWLAAGLGAIAAIWLSRTQVPPSAKEAAGAKP